MKVGVHKSSYEHTLFTNKSKMGELIVVCSYVDDLIFTGNSKELFNELKHSMMTEFDMTDLGKMRFFLGIEVLQNDEGIFIGQKYATSVLET